MEMILLINIQKIFHRFFHSKVVIMSSFDPKVWRFYL